MESIEEALLAAVTGSEYNSAIDATSLLTLDFVIQRLYTSLAVRLIFISNPSHQSLHPSASYRACSMVRP